MALYWEYTAFGDEVLPGEGPGALKEGVEISGGEAPQSDENPLAGAQVQIQAGNVRRGPAAEDPPVLRTHIGQAQPPQLLGDEPLQSEQGGYDKLQLIHEFSFSRKNTIRSLSLSLRHIK